MTLRKWRKKAVLALSPALLELGFYQTDDKLHLIFERLSPIHNQIERITIFPSDLQKDALKVDIGSVSGGGRTLAQLRPRCDPDSSEFIHDADPMECQYWFCPDETSLQAAFEEMVSLFRGPLMTLLATKPGLTLEKLLKYEKGLIEVLKEYQERARSLTGDALLSLQVSIETVKARLEEYRQMIKAKRTED
jgi:hypothetical protein